MFTESGPIECGNPGTLLPPVLKRIERIIKRKRDVGSSTDANDPAHN